MPPPRRANRWLQLAFGVACMILVANLQYAWTLFVEPLHLAHGWTRADIQTAFVIFVATETWLTPLEGWIVDQLGPRLGPRLMIATGGVLVAAGWAVNGLAATLGTLYLGAILSGIGAGAVYATCVGNAVKWFPDRRGLAVGATAAGFGAGAALTVVPIRWLIASAGYAQTFLWVGLAQGLLLFSLAPVMRAPMPVEIVAPARAARLQSAVGAAPLQVLASPAFWLLYAMFVLVSASGLMLTAQIAPIARDFGLTARTCCPARACSARRWWSTASRTGWRGRASARSPTGSGASARWRWRSRSAPRATGCSRRSASGPGDS